MLISAKIGIASRIILGLQRAKTAVVNLAQDLAGPPLALPGGGVVPYDLMPSALERPIIIHMDPVTGVLGGGGGIAPRLTFAEVNVFPYKVRRSDFTQGSTGFDSVAGLLSGRQVRAEGIEDVLPALLAAINDLSLVSERSGRLNVLLHQVQAALPGLSTENNIFEFLAQAINGAGFNRVLVYKYYPGGGIQCRFGAGISPRVSDFSPERAPKIPAANELFEIALREAVLPGDPVLLQRVDRPAQDPRCNLERILGGPARYHDPQIAVPLIDPEGKVRGIFSVWTEANGPELFDPHACSQFILLANMVAGRLSQLSS